MEYYISQIIEGISTGSLYGLVGLSMMFTFRSSRVFNFAQGEMATAVAFVAAFLLKVGYGWPAVAVAFVFAFLLGAFIPAGVLNLIRDRSELSTIIVTIGLFSIINSLNSWAWGHDPVPFPSPFPEGEVNLGFVVSYQSLGILGLTLLTSLILLVIFKYTLVGIAFQAISEDQMAARLMGVRIWLMVPLAWGVSAAVGGLAGMLAAHVLFLHPNTMGTILLYALSAAVIGGLQTSFGALIGGIIIGVAENLSTTVDAIGTGLKTPAVFAILILFLTFRPRGLFGRDEPRKI